MGTETFIKSFKLLYFLCVPVKLNNPLMGTETFYSKPQNLADFEAVKLNNPLMGTETTP